MPCIKCRVVSLQNMVSPSVFPCCQSICQNYFQFVLILLGTCVAGKKKQRDKHGTKIPHVEPCHAKEKTWCLLQTKAVEDAFAMHLLHTYNIEKKMAMKWGAPTPKLVLNNAIYFSCVWTLRNFGVLYQYAFTGFNNTTWMYMYIPHIWKCKKVTYATNFIEKITYDKISGITTLKARPRFAI